MNLNQLRGLTQDLFNNRSRDLPNTSRVGEVPLGMSKGRTSTEYYQVLKVSNLFEVKLYS